MKAFKLSYDTAGKSSTMTVLAEDESKLEEAVSLKDKDFKVGDHYSRISFKREIPLSNVMVSDLSVTELLTLINKK